MGNLEQELTKLRGFEEVQEEHKAHHTVYTDEKKKKVIFPKEVKLPKRADEKSAGYDFYMPCDLTLSPMQKTIVFTDVKAYMQEDELLQIYIRSSLAIKQGLMLSNNVGIIDSSYYNNKGNDGNIGIALVNTTGKTIQLKEGDRIAQGVFIKFLTIDMEELLDTKRTGGMGSSGK